VIAYRSDRKSESNRPKPADARFSPHRDRACSTPSSADSGECFFASRRQAQTYPEEAATDRAIGNICRELLSVGGAPAYATAMAVTRLPSSLRSYDERENASASISMKMRPSFPTLA
jgi:hypothetical protein